MSVSKHIKEAQAELESLLGWARYQAESEVLKDYLRELRSRYPGEPDVEGLRRRLDRALGSRGLSELVRELREEEMH